MMTQTWKTFSAAGLFGLLFSSALAHALSCDSQVHKESSPDAKLELTLCLSKGGVPAYALDFEKERVLDLSRLGLLIKDQNPLEGDFRVLGVSRRSVDQKWEQVWGEERYIRDQHRELRVSLAQGERKMDLVFRVFNDGLGFRYEIPRQRGLETYVVQQEKTEFRFAENGEAWWIPAFDIKTYENLYRKNRLSDLSMVHTPLTIEMKNYVVSVHEAAVVDYPTIALRSNGKTALSTELTPWPDGTGAKVKGPLKTPWRTVQVARTPGELITSYLVLNLNEPSKIADTSWIKPTKYMGIWWALHTGRGSWAPKYGDLGATTENTIAHMDRAKALGIPALLVEGWNDGWDDGKFSFTKANPKFDIKKVTEHGRQIGVALIGHHETNGQIALYEKQLEAGLALYEKLGIHAVKTGYVGDRVVEGGEYHYGQRMVQHHQKVVERAAAHKVMLDVHEPVKDTGLRRTWPNLMTREGMRGMEYDAWSDENGNPPSHTAILPFTRGLSGPMDYTPGIFDLLIGGRRGENRIRTTLAKQLALFVVLYSPLQMAADLPEFYEKHPMFQFVRDVPVDWFTTQVPHARIGEFITVLRKDRHSEDWYLGALTNEKARQLDLKLDFLERGKTYCAQIYRDAADADWKSKPLAYEIQKQKVTAKDRLKLRLAPGGGQAIRFEANAENCVAKLPLR
ncbi:MAG TPA: glycoside hydrolase family 97 protein [Bdellovibrionota bacterium]|nr:glycoside hydrolase family 97 protein [Bdellovibrionota bacterium]